MRLFAVVAASLFALACGGATSAAPTTPTQHEAPSPAASTPADATSCTIASSDLRVALPLAEGESFRATARDACTLSPAGEAPLPWLILVSTREVADPRDEPSVTEEEGPLLSSVDVTLLGHVVASATRSTRHPLVGQQGTETAIELPLDRRMLRVVIVEGATSTQHEALIARVATMTSPAASASLDPNRVACDAGEVSLTVPLPEGGHQDATYRGQCMLAEGDAESGEWSLRVTTIPRETDGVEPLLAESADAVQQWFDPNAPAGTHLLAREDVSMLGEATRLFTYEVPLPSGTRVIAMARILAPEGVMLATLNVRPSRRAVLPALVDALAHAERAPR